MIFFIDANLPLNIGVFSGKLDFLTKKKGKNGLTEKEIFQQPIVGWRSTPYKSITEYDYLNVFVLWNAIFSPFALLSIL